MFFKTPFLSEDFEWNAVSRVFLMLFRIYCCIFFFEFMDQAWMDKAESLTPQNFQVKSFRICPIQDLF